MQLDWKHNSLKNDITEMSLRITERLLTGWCNPLKYNINKTDYIYITWQNQALNELKTKD